MKKYMNEIEAAEYLSVKTDTMKYWRTTENGPPFIKAPTGMVRYLADELDAWIVSRGKQGGKE
jgi:hypothetical protein